MRHLRGPPADVLHIISLGVQEPEFKKPLVQHSRLRIIPRIRTPCDTWVSEFQICRVARSENSLARRFSYSFDFTVSSQLGPDPDAGHDNRQQAPCVRFYLSRETHGRLFRPHRERENEEGLSLSIFILSADKLRFLLRVRIREKN